MVDSLDLFIAVIGIVAAIVGTSAPLWMALSKKVDKDDLARLQARMDAKLDALEARLGARIDTLDVKVDSVETRLGATLTRVETKLDSLILRLVPEQPHPRELGAGGS